MTVANQIYNRFKAAGKPLNPGDVGIMDAADYHYYQVSTRHLLRYKSREQLLNMVSAIISLAGEVISQYSPTSSYKT